jgi:hypothetical protein
VQTGRGGSPKLILGFGGFLTAGHRGGWGGGAASGEVVGCCLGRMLQTGEARGGGLPTKEEEGRRRLEGGRRCEGG